MKKKLPKRKLRLGQYVKLRYDGRIHIVEAIDPGGRLVLIRPSFEISKFWTTRARLTILVEHAPA